MANVASLKAINAYPQEAKGKEIGDRLEVVLRDADFGDDLPLSDQLKFQQTTSFALRAQFNSTVAAVFNRHAHKGRSYLLFVIG
jgi:hypothetical protein